jgi:heme A synthase
VLLALAVVVFGAFAVLTGLPPVVAAIDLGSALLVLALMVTATTVALSRHYNPALPDRLLFHTPFARLTLLTVILVFSVLVSGVLVAESSTSMVRCLGWPLYSGVSFSQLGWPSLLRYLVTIVAGILIAGIVIQVWRAHRNRPAIFRTAMALGAVFVAEIIVGLLLPVANFTIFLLIAYVALAALLWALLVALAVLVGLVSQ